jgi:NAD(P)-dependent dehydrogenase (short-subunit alcohol dehydrogenase family)
MRRMGKPEDIARVVLFLASDQSGSERISVSGEQW